MAASRTRSRSGHCCAESSHGNEKFRFAKNHDLGERCQSHQSQSLAVSLEIVQVALAPQSITVERKQPSWSSAITLICCPSHARSDRSDEWPAAIVAPPNRPPLQSLRSTCDVYTLRMSRLELFTILTEVETARARVRKGIEAKTKAARQMMMRLRGVRKPSVYLMNYYSLQKPWPSYDAR